MSKSYYCTKCKQRHIKGKAIGDKHAEFKGEAPKVTTPPDPPAPDETPDEVVVAVTPRQNCEACKDTGLVSVGTGTRSDGREYSHDSYCKCGQETHDERIGLTPRRPDLREAQPISDEDRAEADWRRSSGGTHDEYLALGTDGSGGE